MQAIPQDVQVKVRQALEDPRYRWRTVRGISSDVRLSPQEVANAMKVMPDDVVRSSRMTKDGQPIFTTRRHLRATSTFAERLVRALRNRGD